LEPFFGRLSSETEISLSSLSRSAGEKVFRNFLSARSLRLGGGDLDAEDLEEEELDDEDDDDDERCLRFLFFDVPADRGGSGDAERRSSDCSGRCWGGAGPSGGASSRAGEDRLRAGEQDLLEPGSGERLGLTATTWREGLLETAEVWLDTLPARELLRLRDAT
jgi:hypothetical protein